MNRMMPKLIASATIRLASSRVTSWMLIGARGQDRRLRGFAAPATEPAAGASVMPPS